MIKIGDFSKLVQVPIATLRYYDQVGLLKPLEVDKFTGYRYYSASQLPRLHRILALKGLGFSLEQIGAVLAENPTPEEMRGMLRLRHAQITQQLDEMRNQLLEVEIRLNQIEREDNLPSYDVLLRQVEPILVAMVRDILPTHGDVGALYPEVYGNIEPHISEALGPRPGEAGQTLAIWYDDELRDSDHDGAAVFVLRCRIPEKGRMKVLELPRTLMATTVHHGSYNRLGDAYEAIARWVEANGYQITGESREVYLYNQWPVSRDDESYVTEVQFAVTKME